MTTCLVLQETAKMSIHLLEQVCVKTTQTMPRCYPGRILSRDSKLVSLPGRALLSAVWIGWVSVEFSHPYYFFSWVQPKRTVLKSAETVQTESLSRWNIDCPCLSSVAATNAEASYWKRICFGCGFCSCLASAIALEPQLRQHHNNENRW